MLFTPLLANLKLAVTMHHYSDPFDLIVKECTNRTITTSYKPEKKAQENNPIVHKPRNVKPTRVDLAPRKFHVHSRAIAAIPLARPKTAMQRP